MRTIELIFALFVMFFLGYLLGRHVEEKVQHLLRGPYGLQSFFVILYLNPNKENRHESTNVQTLRIHYQRWNGNDK